jgi:hypothetical protein
MKKVAIVGAQRFPVIAAGPAIFDWLKETVPLGTTIYTRGSKGFDRYLAEGARFMGYTVVEMPGSGGADNYVRDVRLVETVDEVYAFFEADHIGEGGTQHVIDKALDQRRPSHSYIWDDRALVLVGSDDGAGDPDDDAPPFGEPPEAPGEEPEEPAGEGSSSSPVWPNGYGDLPF